LLRRVLYKDRAEGSGLGLYRPHAYEEGVNPYMVYGVNKLGNGYSHHLRLILIEIITSLR
jgi:hypothetical protein